MAGHSNAIYHTEQQKSLKSYSKNAIGVKKASRKGHFTHTGNEIKICSQNKCHHHLSNVCENSFRMFHSNWVISHYHSFVRQFEFPWLNLTNCPNKWMVMRNDPVTVKHTKWIFTDVGKVMMAFILATDFDFIAYISKMAFFFFGSFFHANGVLGIWYDFNSVRINGWVVGFDPPLGTFSGRGDFSLGVNMGSNSVPPKTPSDESINRGLVCAHMHFIARTQKILTFMS